MPLEQDGALHKEGDFDSSARRLYEKYRLIDSFPLVDKVINQARTFVEKHRLPDEFLKDEINLALLLGSTQKLVESQDPYYKERLELFLARLVAPVAKETIDAGELFGILPDHAGLDDEETKTYVLSKTDKGASEAFRQKHANELEECKKVWKEKGYDLDVKVYIVGDTRQNFIRNIRAAGFIKPPDRTKLSTQEFKPVVEIVLLKGHSAESDAMIQHEFYHIKDYFGFQRRGYESQVFETLDELHTEFAVGNFTERFADRSGSSGQDGSYFTIKEFWTKFSFTAGLDFGLIGDREATLDVVIRRFGFAGLVDFAMMSAHTSGKGSIFDTFHQNPNLPIILMLIEGEKITLRRVLKRGEVRKVMQDTPPKIEEMAELMSPRFETDSFPRYKGVDDFIPTRLGKVYAARTIGDSWSMVVDNIKARSLVSSFARGVALLELKNQGEIFGYDDIIQVTQGSLAKVHFGRKQEFVPDEYVERYKEDALEKGQNIDEFYYAKIRGMYHSLVYDTEGNEFVTGINNPDVRIMFFAPFAEELNILAQYCLDNKDSRFVEWFIDGIYGYILPFELREMSVDYLIQKFPKLKDVLEKRRTQWDSRHVANFGFM